MTNRPGHDPTEESNEQIYRFLEHVLKPADDGLDDGSGDSRGVEPEAGNDPRGR